MSDSDIVDGEIVSSESKVAPVQTSTDILLNLESLIKNHVASVDKLTSEARELKEMLEDIFNNDPTYKEHSDKAKEATKVKQGTKAQILKQPQAHELDEKI